MQTLGLPETFALAEVAQAIDDALGMGTISFDAVKHLRRIDDPKAGWKGKGVWTTRATRALFPSETGKGTTSKAVKFELRPDPLAD